MIFANPEMLWLALVAIPLIYWRRARTRVSHSATTNIPRIPWSHAVLSVVPTALLAMCVILGAVALARPQRITQIPTGTLVPGRDIMIALDYSYSMAQPFAGEVPATKSKENIDWEDPPPATAETDTKIAAANKAAQKPRRIDAAMASLLAFVDTRLESSQQDAIGLIAFDRHPLLRWPLDRDLRQIIRHGNFLPKGKAPEGFGEGTNFGTTGPGPIDLAIRHFVEYGRSQSRVLIIVSDGEDKLSEEARVRLEKALRKEHVQLYVVGVGLSKDSVDIIKFAERVGGKESVFRVENAGDLVKCFRQIDQLESSPVPMETVRKHDELFVIPLVLALILVLSWSLLEAILFGR